jgi:hypothetical protein
MIERAFMTRSELAGHDLARLLKDRLHRDGLVTSEPIEEDWGWALLVPFQGDRFTLSVSTIDESVECRVGISFEKGLNGVRGWFRSPPAGKLSALGRVLENVLRSEPRIAEVTNL